MTFSGKPSPASRAQAIDPRRAASRASRRAGARSPRRSSALRQLERRQPRRVQDLVRVRVADAAEEVRIGQRALERVVLARERRVELLERRRRAARGRRDRARASAASPAHELQRRALLRARLGQQQRAVREVERRQDHLRPDARRSARLAPAQPPRDHQVDDQEELVVELEHDALADAPHAADDLAGDRVDRRRHRAQDERARQHHLFEHSAGHLRPQRFHVDHDVWKFRHSPAFYARPACRGRSATSSFEREEPKEYRGRLI